MTDERPPSEESLALDRLTSILSRDESLQEILHTIGAEPPLGRADE